MFLGKGKGNSGKVKANEAQRCCFQVWGSDGEGKGTDKLWRAFLLPSGVKRMEPPRVLHGPMEPRRGCAWNQTWVKGTHQPWGLACSGLCCQTAAHPGMSQTLPGATGSAWALQATLHARVAAIPVSSVALLRRPIFFRWLGVETDRDRTSPMASWKPGLAPLRKETGWSLYCR